MEVNQKLKNNTKFELVKVDTKTARKSFNYVNHSNILILLDYYHFFLDWKSKLLAKLSFFVIKKFFTR